MQKPQFHVKNILSEAGLKATPQRILLYRALSESSCHPSAEDLYSEVNPQLPGLSLATVYSTLETFVNSGLATKVPVVKGKMRYDARLENHFHAYCTNTNEIIDFVDPELESLIQDYFKRKSITNFTISKISLQLRGTKPLGDQEINFLN
jgi:Fur family peroxide stress response transcriptional regulator